MSDKPDKLQAKHFAIDVPMRLTIADVGENSPYVTAGENDWGTWWMYSVTVNGAKRSFFPSNALQQQIIELHAETAIGVGTELAICKHDRTDGGPGVWWAVGLSGTATEPPGALPQTAPPAPTPAQEVQKQDKIGGTNRMAFAALAEATRQLPDDASNEDRRGWASTILIAYQKAGIGPSDFPDIGF